MKQTEYFGYLERVANSLLWGLPVPPYPIMPQFDMECEGFVEPKERQRTGKSGHHYTPADTRRYENMVRTAAIARMRELGLIRFERPVAVQLFIHDQIHSKTPDWMRELMKTTLVYEHTGGDLDNKEKAVLDALNQIVYRDDRLVVNVYKNRSYEPRAGFRIIVTQTGFNKSDLAIVEKLIKSGKQNGSEEGSSRKAR